MEASPPNFPDVLFHSTYRALMPSIEMNGLGGKGSEEKRWEDSVDGIVYLAKDRDVAVSYAETSETAPEEWLDEIVTLEVRVADLDPSKISIDRNVQGNEGDTFEYEGTIPFSILRIIP